MPIFSLKRAFTPPKGRTPGESFLRFMLLIAIFVGAGWLYSVHFERSLDAIEARTAINDQTKSLTSDQKQAFREFSKVLKNEFGLELKLVFAAEPPPWPELDNKTIYLGLDTAHHTVDIAVPPLVERALGPGYVDMLKNEHFPPFFEQNRWAMGTAEALADIWKRLIEVDRPSGQASTSSGTVTGSVAPLPTDTPEAASQPPAQPAPQPTPETPHVTE